MLRRTFFQRLLAAAGGLIAGTAPVASASAVARVQACAELPGCATVDDMLRTARQIARFVLGIDPPHRQAAMKRLAAENRVMHDLVRGEVAGLRAAARKRREDAHAQGEDPPAGA